MRWFLVSECPGQNSGLQVGQGDPDDSFDDLKERHHIGSFVLLGRFVFFLSFEVLTVGVDFKVVFVDVFDEFIQ